MSLVVFWATVSCDVGSEAGGAARRIGEGLATRVVPDQVASTAPSAASTPVHPELAEILVSLEELEIAERGSDVEYNRSDWRHWIDDDGDCQNTRAEVLIQENLGTVAFASPERCRVTAGRWLGPWSGEFFADASDVDVDHHVPLAHAHVSGGWRWDPERKRAYANDLSNPNSLQITSETVNRSKGKKPPDEWLPDDETTWCRYAADWVSVKRQWELTVANAEVSVLREMLATCGSVDSYRVGGSEPK